MRSSGRLGLADAGMEIWAGMALLGLLGFVLGFALNHGSICTVIATRELVSEKRPARSIALVECAVWATLVYAILETSPTMRQGWSPLGYLLPAAMLFGIGTYVNGACVFGSVGHFGMDGCGSPWDLKHTAPVGSLKPNAFGLHDMHGNVWERVEDTWHQNYDGAPTDGSAWLRGGEPSYRVVRSGSWRNESAQVRAAVRFKRNINVRLDTLGFRVAGTIEP
jgi:hypothetical protein